MAYRIPFAVAADRSSEAIVLATTAARIPAGTFALRGFTMVEILVGMLIAMFGILIMLQVFALFEGQKRTTTGASEAQMTGAIALYQLTREARQAGWGMSHAELLGCDLQLRAGAVMGNMGPVVINHTSATNGSIPAGDLNTDTLLVLYGNNHGSTEGVPIYGQPSQNTYSVNTPANFAINDYVIAKPPQRPNPCSGAAGLIMEQVAAVAAQNVGVPVGVNLGNNISPTNTFLFNVGTRPLVAAYAVRNQRLTRCDWMASDCVNGATTDPTIWVPIAESVVSMRVQYGVDTTMPMDGVVDTYQQTAPVNACDWVRIQSIRLALVTRSSQYDKNLTSVQPTWSGSATLPIDVSGTDPNWSNYRYRVFQTDIPLRNSTWTWGNSGC